MKAVFPALCGEVPLSPVLCGGGGGGEMCGCGGKELNQECCQKKTPGQAQSEDEVIYHS